MYNGYFVSLSGGVVLVGNISCWYVTLSEEILHVSYAHSLCCNRLLVYKNQVQIYHFLFFPPCLGG